MTKLELLANDIAFLNDNDLLKLAMILVEDYTTRADALYAKIGAAFFDTEMETV
jgi:hypothetical protein